MEKILKTIIGNLEQMNCLDTLSGKVDGWEVILYTEVNGDRSFKFRRAQDPEPLSKISETGIEDSSRRGARHGRRCWPS